MNKALLPLIILGTLFLLRCKKEKLITDTSAQLAFSIDTLTFDTVFTTLGSATRQFKIYNPHKQPIKVSTIQLMGGESSNFRINIDAISGHTFSNIEIPAGDSVYGFVEVTVDPTNDNNPIVIYDQVQCITNGNTQSVTLEAWGQDAHFYKGAAICNETWTNDKPYVIVNSLLVDSGCTLRISPGVKVFSANNSGIFVRGTLEVLGNPDDSIVFQGLRLETFYKDLPGQWLGIFLLRGSKNNHIQHSIIKNGVFGVSAGSNDNPDLTTFNEQNLPDVSIENTIIKNKLSVGVFGFLSQIIIKSSLIYNCGEHNAQFAFGGSYDIINSTLVNYGSSDINHKEPIVHMSNFVESSQGKFSANLNANFINCIIYGSLDDEIDFDNDGISPFEYFFDYCILKTEKSDNNFTNTFRNEDPLFISVNEENFRVDDNSPAIDAGRDLDNNSTLDLDGGSRVQGSRSDIGAYEKPD